MNHRIPRQHRVYSMSADNPPALAVAPGDTVTFETSDCFDGQIDLAALLPSYAAADRARGNPATGPVAVAGAAPDDTLVAEIMDIRCAPQGVIFGADREHSQVAGHVVDVQDGIARAAGFFALPINPVVGVIGVAPATGAIRDTTPGDHGGNLDTTDVRIGARVHLPIFVEGALFALGDLHALQGDGELCGMGIEIAGEVDVRLTLQPGQVVPRPVVETESYFAICASAETLDDAATAAVASARDFLIRARGVTDQEATMLLSMMGNLRVSQIVNPLRTVRVTIPKQLLTG